MNQPGLILWLAALVFFLIIEGATAQLVSIWFVIGAAAALVVSLLHGPMWLQIAVFVVVSAAALILTRPIVRRLTAGRVHPTNADRILGAECLVTEAIDNLAGTGAVAVDGKTWTARSADGSDIPEGTLVTVLSIEGVKAIVSACAKNEE
ncbi:MAG: NfeD family protein [Oscillospiraceae bacterium]|nr:NfeD family protein [Oscillospiraceae bacterium]